MKPYLYVQTQWWNPIDWSIKATTRSHWSHAGIVFGDKYFSAQADGVKWRPRDKDCELLILDHPHTQQALDWAVTQEGKPYDFTAIAGIFFDRNWRDDSHWYCSELVTVACEHTPVRLFNMDVVVNNVWPRDIPMSLSVKILGKG